MRLKVMNEWGGGSSQSGDMCQCCCGGHGRRSLIFYGARRGSSPYRKLFQHSEKCKLFMEFRDHKDSYSASRSPSPCRWNSAEEEPRKCGVHFMFPCGGDRCRVRETVCSWCCSPDSSCTDNTNDSNSISEGINDDIITARNCWCHMWEEWLKEWSSNVSGLLVCISWVLLFACQFHHFVTSHWKRTMLLWMDWHVKISGWLMSSLFTMLQLTWWLQPLPQWHILYHWMSH